MATRVHLNKKYKFIKKKYTYFFKKIKIKIQKKKNKKKKSAKGSLATPGS
jgi:hypothetical protein